MSRLIVKNGIIVKPDGYIPNATVVCENGRISDVAWGDAAEKIVPAENDQVIDCVGKFISAGFIDMHVHGGGGHDFMDGSVEAMLGAVESHAQHGTTAIYPTTLTSSMEDLYETFEIFREARKLNDKGARMMGLHLEGPFFSPKMAGAQDPRYLLEPKPEIYNDILKRTDDIKRWSVAPELEGAIDFGRFLKEKGIVASVAHTAAEYSTVMEAFDAGYTLMTHFLNAMSTVKKIRAIRHAGAVEAAYMRDSIDVEVIADGIHVPKELLGYVCKFKGYDHVALCTDAMRAAGMPDGEYLLGSLKDGQPVVKEDGVAKLHDRSALAGSVCTTDRLVRTMNKIVGVDLYQAVKMMTCNPARMMGVEKEMGTVEVGKYADMVIFDYDINIEHTIIGGKVVK